MRMRTAFRWIFAAAVLTLGVCGAGAQVFVVGSFDPRLTPQPYKETSVQLSSQRLDAKTHQQLIRIMQAEQAFTMRAMPMGHHGLILHANGKVTPEGSDYQKEISENGIAIGPGGKAIVTDVHIESDRIVLDLNGGPDKKHKWLQHVQLGGSFATHQLAPSEPDAVGARVTLLFHGYVPELTGTQVKALLRPLLNFAITSPLEAYTDTLPPKLKAAVLEHRVLVGMDREMVLQAMSQPERKLHESDTSGFRYDEWIYGTPPHDVQMVRFAGDRVIQVEVAAIGKDPVIRNHDETDGYLASRGPAPAHTHDVQEGDDSPTSGTHRAPPSLRKPGEPVPADASRPVEMPPSQQNPPGQQNLAGLTLLH